MLILKLRSHLLTAEPRTTPVTYRDDPGRSGVKLLLRSALCGNSQLTTTHPGCAPDHPGRAQAKLRFMPVLPRSFPDDAGRAPVDPGRAQDDAGRAPVEPRLIENARK
jgi:hypothetical protein